MVPAEITRRREEVFLTVLGESTRLRMIELNKSDINEIFGTINSIVEEILTHHDKKMNERRSRNSTTATREQKWCKHHKNNTHNTSDCYTLEKAGKTRYYWGKRTL